MKTMLITFFVIEGIVRFEFVPQGQTVNQAYYVETLKRIREAVLRRRPELWPNDWNLHHDSVPAHSVPLAWRRKICGCFQKLSQP
jgi:hypothetical protein